MGIKGLTDRQEARFPRIGILRKGAPKPANSNAPGKDLKWFRFVTEDQAAAADFLAAFGDNPASILIYLPFATTDENFEAWQEEWGAGSLKHRCDGETCVIWQMPDGTYSHEPKPCPGKCKPTGRLMVIVPQLRRLAYVQVLTTSKWDIIELTGNLRAIEGKAHNHSLLGIPMLLTRQPAQISTPPRQGQANRTRVEKWLLHLEAAPEWVALQIEAAKRAALPALPEGLTYPNGDDDGDEEAIDSSATQLYTEPEPEPESEIPELTPEQRKTAFYDRVRLEIPFYHDIKSIGEALRAAQFKGYSPDKEAAMFAALQDHATVEANKVAAQEEMTLDEMADMGVVPA